MGRTIGRLTALTVTQATKGGLYPDGAKDNLPAVPAGGSRGDLSPEETAKMHADLQRLDGDDPQSIAEGPYRRLDIGDMPRRSVAQKWARKAWASRGFGRWDRNRSCRLHGRGARSRLCRVLPISLAEGTHAAPCDGRPR